MHHVLTARVVHLISRMTKRGRMQSEAERAVKDLLERGPVSRERATAYQRALNALVAARVARRTPEGGYELARRDAPAPHVRRTEPPPSAGDAVLTLELPEDCVAMLDALAPTRGEAVVRALRPYMGSGVWKR